MNGTNSFYSIVDIILLMTFVFDIIFNTDDDLTRDKEKIYKSEERSSLKVLHIFNHAMILIFRQI